MAGPPDAKTRTSLHDAIEWLRGKDGRHPVVVMGARMGGRDALALSGEPGVIGVVSWYGTPAATLPERHAPILAMFGGKDFGPTVEDARRLEAATRGAKVTVEVFPDAQHGFADPNNTWGGYDKKAAEASYFLAFKFLIDVRP
jgi:dienelactone hydrolase